MTTPYEFTLVVDRDPTDLAEQLFEVGHGDYVPEGPNPPLVHVRQDAATLLAAIASAVHAIQSVGLAAVGLRSEDLICVKEVAARLSRTYESVRLLVTGNAALVASPPRSPTDSGPCTHGPRLRTGSRRTTARLAPPTGTVRSLRPTT